MQQITHPKQNNQNDKAVHPLQATSAGPSLPKWACPLVLKCSKMLIQEYECLQGQKC